MIRNFETEHRERIAGNAERRLGGQHLVSPIGEVIDMNNEKLNTLWFVLLLVAIVMAFTMRFPLNMVQAIARAFLLGIKLKIKL